MYDCKFCDFSTDYKNSINRHIRIKHRSEPTADNITAYSNRLDNSLNNRLNNSLNNIPENLSTSSSPSEQQQFKQWSKQFKQSSISNNTDDVESFNFDIPQPVKSTVKDVAKTDKKSSTNSRIGLGIIALVVSVILIWAFFGDKIRDTLVGANDGWLRDSLGNPAVKITRE
jgi:hypothetical protein